MEYLGYLMKTIIIIILFFMGATIFSFVSLVLDGIKEKKNIFYKRSKCPLCGHELKIKESFPIFGYMSTKGYCRYCYKKKPVTPICIEFLGGALFALITAICLFI